MMSITADLHLAWQTPLHLKLLSVAHLSQYPGILAPALASNESMHGLLTHRCKPVSEKELALVN
jgi:hypothetical protein